MGVLCLLMGSPAASGSSDSRALDAIMDNWFLSLGGLGTKTWPHTYAVEETAEVEGRPEAKLQMRVLRTFQGRFRMEMTRPGAVVTVQAWDGRVGWQSQPDGGIGLLDNPAGDLWFLENDLLFAVRAFSAPISASVTGRETLNGHDCFVAALTDSHHIGGTCYFERGSRRLIRVRRELSRGSKESITEDFDDYRKLEGLEVPYKVRVQVGQTVVRHERTKVTLNPVIEESQFVLSTAQYQEAVEVRDLLRRRDQGMGGSDALARVRTRVTHLTLEVSTTGTTSTETIYQKQPGLILIESLTPGMGLEARGFDGRTGWFSSELQGYRPLKPKETAEMMSEGGVHLIGPLEAEAPLRRRLGERMIGDRATIAVALANLQGPAGTFYFDRDTARLVRIASPVTGDRENSTEATIDFTDYRKVDGLEIPFVVIRSNSLTRSVSTVVSLENNPVLKEDLFKPRTED